MAEVKFNTTLVNKANTVVLSHYDELGNPSAFEGGTKMYIATLAGTLLDIPGDNSSHGIGDISTLEDASISNVFTAIVDLSGVVGVDSDYDHPTYEHTYSIRSTNNTYMYGKLNIVDVP